MDRASACDLKAAQYEEIAQRHDAAGRHADAAILRAYAQAFRRTAERVLLGEAPDYSQ